MSGHISEVVSRKDLKTYRDQELRQLAYEYELEVNDPEFDFTDYVPPGDVAREFINSTYLTSVIMGPLGGGKTTACIFKRIYAATIAPIARHPADGKPTRMCRWIVVRDTFRSAERTVLASWDQWFPKTYPGSSHAGGNDRPAIRTLRFIGPDGIRVEAMTTFAGLGEHDVETLMKGTEWSGAWLNEVDTHADGSLEDMEQRVGRYPMQGLLIDPDARRMRTVIGDMNAPTTENWTYKALELAPTPDRHLFKQPSGRSPDAENRFNLDEDYYDRIIRNQDAWFVKRMVDNQFGYARSGMPVFDAFNPDVHAAPNELAYDPSLPLYVGIDVSTNSLSCAAAFGQVKASGRIVVLDELYPGHGMGSSRFAETLQQRLAEKFSDVREVKLYLDPAADQGGDKDGGQLNALDTIRMVTELPVRIAGDGSNELGLRLGAVKAELRGHLEPHTTLLVSRKCKGIIAAFTSEYRFKKKTGGDGTQYEDKPEKKHPTSDLMDAVQYLVLGIRKRVGALHAIAGTDHNRGNNSQWRSQAGSGSKTGKGGFDPHKAGL